MRDAKKGLGGPKRDLEDGAEEIVDDIPTRGRRVDDRARDELAEQIAASHSRRQVLRLGAAAGGGLLAALAGRELLGYATGSPGAGTGGATISDTDVDAKRIAGVRIATEFASSPHAGTDTDPYPGSATQAALDDLPAEGGAVFVPSGIYNVADPLHITKSNVSLVGAGDATRLKTDGSGFTANSSGMIEIIGSYRGVSVERLFLDGANTDTCRGIIVKDGSEVLISSCSFANWLGTLSQRGRGVTVVHNPATEEPPHKGVRVEGCYFTNNQIGVVMHRTIYTIANSYFESNAWDGMYMEGTARGVIIGNLVTFSPRVGIYLIWNDRQTVVGNRVEDCGSGIEVYEARGMSILGNHIERCSSAGVNVRSNSAHCVVSGNVIGYCPNVPGIRLSSSVRSCVVTDNVLRGNGDGVAVLGSSTHRVAGNACMENGSAGIRIQDSDHILILENRAYAQSYGLRADGSSDFLVVKHNDLRGNSTDGMSLVGSYNVVADNWE